MSLEDMQTQWKNKYLSMGLPSTLLDAMITEANAEYASIIGFGDINRLADLTIIINDPDATSNAFYVIIILFDMYALQGDAQTAITQKFTQLPCVSLTACVFKVLDDFSRTICQGYANINHSKDENLTVNLNADNELDNLQYSNTTYQIFDINDGIINMQEIILSSDAFLFCETANPHENLTGCVPHYDAAKPTESIGIVNT